MLNEHLSSYQIMARIGNLDLVPPARVACFPDGGFGIYIVSRLNRRQVN
jgi:hypothetical protein